MKSKRRRTFRQFLKDIGAVDLVFNNKRADRMFLNWENVKEIDKKMLYDTKEK